MSWSQELESRCQVNDPEKLLISVTYRCLGANPSPGTTAGARSRNCPLFEGVHHWKRAERRYSTHDRVEDVMKHGFILAWVTALAVSAPALAEAPVALHSEVAQPQIPARPASTAPGAVVLLLLPRRPQDGVGVRHHRSQLWEAGDRSWNARKILGRPGETLRKPARRERYAGLLVTVGRSPGLVEGRWNYSGVGSSTPRRGIRPRGRGPPQSGPAR